jgi:hypothetical protein
VSPHKSCATGSRTSPPIARCKHLRRLHCKVTVNSISRAPEGASGHSILQHDMPDDEEPDCEEVRQNQLEYSLVAIPTCQFLGKSRTDVRDPQWQSWSFQVISEPLGIATHGSEGMGGWSRGGAGEGTLGNISGGQVGVPTGKMLGARLRRGVSLGCGEQEVAGGREPSHHGAGEGRARGDTCELLPPPCPPLVSLLATLLSLLS